MKQYFCLFRGGDAREAQLSEENNQEHMAKWGAYMGQLAQNGNLEGGMPLQQDGRIMTTDGTKEAVWGEGTDIIGGYLIINANDYEQAVTLTKDCPIFEYNGTVEIREIMPMEAN